MPSGKERVALLTGNGASGVGTVEVKAPLTGLEAGGAVPKTGGPEANVALVGNGAKKVVAELANSEVGGVFPRIEASRAVPIGAVPMGAVGRPPEPAGRDVAAAVTLRGNGADGNVPMFVAGEIDDASI